MLRRIWSHALLGTVTFLASSAWLVGGAASQAGIIVEPWIDTSNRAAVAVAFAAEYGTETPGMDWTGDHGTCDPGSSSSRLAMATLRRVNYYRAMAGVPAGVGLSADFSDKAQHAALAMSATGRLSHTPDDTFRCLTSAGREAAANSNLYLGRTGPAAIDGYIEDPGDRNRDVGHRNTILHPPTTEIGVGHVQGSGDGYPANALWVFDDRVFDDNPPLREPAGFVAWPPRGFVPPPLVYPRWSFGLAGADFDDATVTMRGPDGPVPLEIVARQSQQGYVPAPIIVWEPADELWTDPDLPRDLAFDVAVRGVRVDGRTVDFDYRVVVLGDRAADPPAGR